MSFRNELHVQEYIYDFDVDGGAQGAIDLSAKANKVPLPDGAVVKAVYAKVLTAVTSGGAPTVAWGNTSDPDGYSGAGHLKGALLIDVVFNGWDNGAVLIWDDTNDHPIYFAANSAALRDMLLTIATADLTAGKIAILVEYVLPTAA